VARPGRATGRPQPAVVASTTARPSNAANWARRRRRRQSAGESTNATAPRGSEPATITPITAATSPPSRPAGPEVATDTTQAAGLGEGGCVAGELGVGGGGGAVDGDGRGAVEGGGGAVDGDGGGAVDGVGDGGEGDGEGEGVGVGEGAGGGAVIVYTALALLTCLPDASSTFRATVWEPTVASAAGGV